MSRRGEVSHHRPITEAQERKGHKARTLTGMLVQGSGWSDTWVLGMRRQVWASHYESGILGLQR